MRKLKDRQSVFDFQGSRLAITAEFYAKYGAMDRTLIAVPEILRLVHADLAKALECEGRDRRRESRITSDNVLRVLLVQTAEGLSLRETVVRIDDSAALRRFVGINDGEMMGVSTLCRLKNQIEPSTWKKLNRALAKHASMTDVISGEELRVDTTALETNIHYPRDSHLLFDVYRVIARLVGRARELDPQIARERRLQVSAAKKRFTEISRKAGKRKKEDALKPAYTALLSLVEGVLNIGAEASSQLVAKIRGGKLSCLQAATAEHLVEQIAHFSTLGAQVVDQTTRRVMHGEKVPNDQKLFSIFEPHTELLIRGKAGKPVEFGHMVLLQQTREKFISDFEVFEKKPVEHKLVDGVLKSHETLFGQPPKLFTADKGFYESMATIADLEKKVDLVAIAKLGSRTDEETAREHSLAFRLAQAFRAGIEGTISFLKRVLRMSRCFNKGWKHYAATVGATVFTHNLVVLARQQP